MSVTLPFKRIGTHLYIEVDHELLLVDTGSPDSFTEGRAKVLAPGLRLVHDRSLIFDGDELRRMLGVPTVGVLGMDIIGRCDAVFDLPAGCLTLNLAAMPRPENVHELRAVMNVPVFDLPHDDGVGAAQPGIPVFLDSGTQFSYLSPQRIASHKLSKVKDYSPILGPIISTLYETARPARAVRGRFGVPPLFAAPPRGMATLLGLAGTEGILGIDAFDGVVLLSTREKWVARG